MGLFDSLKRAATNIASDAARDLVNHGINSAVHASENATKTNTSSTERVVDGQTIGKGKNETKTYVFDFVPKSPEELKTLPNFSIDDSFKTAALSLLVLLTHKESKDVCYDMMNVLRGPDPISNLAKSQIDECLRDKEYKVSSFFLGASVQNNYEASLPYSIEVSSNPYSFDNENWATLWVKSAGADSPRPIKLRKKPSTGEWFINEIQCLSDIRLPVADDPWA